MSGVTYTHHLEVREKDGQWKRWCSYTDAEKAAERRDKVASKGYRARLVGPTSQPVPADDTCPWCDEDHDGPMDGSCLL